MAHQRAPFRHWILSSHRYFWFKLKCDKVFYESLANTVVLVVLGCRFQTKIPSRSRIFVQGEQQKCNHTPWRKDQERLDIKWAWFKAQENLILSVVSCLVYYDTLLQNATDIKIHYKLHQLFYYKIQQLS